MLCHLLAKIKPEVTHTHTRNKLHALQTYKYSTALRYTEARFQWCEPKEMPLLRCSQSYFSHILLTLTMTQITLPKNNAQTSKLIDTLMSGYVHALIFFPLAFENILLFYWLMQSLCQKGTSSTYPASIHLGTLF